MKPPRLPEKTVQAQIVAALRSVGAKVYVIGRPPRRDAVHKGTGQTPGIADLLVFLPKAPRAVPSLPERLADGSTVIRTKPAHQLWVECKAAGGRLSPEQRSFRDFCALAGVPHLVGGLDDVLAYLVQHGYVTECAHYRQRSA